MHMQHSRYRIVQTAAYVMFKLVSVHMHWIKHMHHAQKHYDYAGLSHAKCVSSAASRESVILTERLSQKVYHTSPPSRKRRSQS